MSSDPFWQGYRAGEALFAILAGFFRGIGAVLSALTGRSLRVRSSSWRRERKETRKLYDKVKTLFSSSPLGQGRQNDIAIALALEACERAGGEHAYAILEPLSNTTVAFMAEDGLWALPEIDWSREWGLEEGRDIRSFLEMQRRFFADYEKNINIWREKLIRIFEGMMGYLPLHAFRREEEGEGETFNVTLLDLFEDPSIVIERTVATFFDKDVVEARLFQGTRERMDRNILLASGIDPAENGRTNKRVVLPTGAKRKTPSELVSLYLRGTPFGEFFEYPLPFSIPPSVRFEHAHIVGGTGHGKTQLLQCLIHNDLLKVREGKASLIVIDSQGDSLRTLSRLSYFAEPGLSERLILIDPADTDYPVCLNMFDLGRARHELLPPRERERVVTGTIELYEYIFGSLLDAELTQRQGLIFRYIARLMMVIPDATILTLREVLEGGEKWKPFIDKLSGSTRAFFETQFFSKSFEQTKKQILTRLWGILSNPFFERMFMHARSKVDMFEAMQGGKVVLIHTAKDLLKKEGSQMFGRFFIAMIAQAALERAPVPKDERVPVFVYIDEAQEYFDEQIEDLLNQARKYGVGLVFAHQNLDQLRPKLKASIMASTSIKLAGGVSSKDASEFAKEMCCEQEFIQRMRKRPSSTEFACWVKNVTAQPLKVSVPLGMVEELPAMDDGEYESLLAANRERYALVWKEDVEWEESRQIPEAQREHKDERTQKTVLRPEQARSEPTRAAMALEPAPVAEVRVPAKETAPPLSPTSTAPSLVPTVDERARAKHRPSEALPAGRGGRQHKYLQQLIKQVAEEYGFLATIEKQILDGKGSVDLVLEKGNASLACEISVTSTPEQELGNVKKCFATGFQEIILLSSDKKQLTKLQTFISSHLNKEENQNVRFFLPDEFVSYLEERGAQEQATTQTVKGYKVKVKYKALGEEQQKARKQAIAEVIVKSMKRMREE